MREERKGGPVFPVGVRRVLGRRGGPPSWRKGRGIWPRPIAACAVAFLLVLVWPCAVSRGDVQEQEFIWREGNAHMAAARTPEEFIHAARTYRKLVDMGVRNGPLFYNMGTALLAAEQHGEAIVALRRAERYAGSRPDTRRNLLLAMRRAGNADDAALPWYRVPLFWHFGLSAASRLDLTVWAFALFWAGLILGRVGARTWGRTLAVGSVAALVVFGSSAVASLQQEAADEARPMRLAPAGQARVESGEETP